MLVLLDVTHNGPSVTRTNKKRTFVECLLSIEIIKCF